MVSSLLPGHGQDAHRNGRKKRLILAIVGGDQLFGDVRGAVHTHTVRTRVLCTGFAVPVLLLQQRFKAKELKGVEVPLSSLSWFPVAAVFLGL